MKLARLRTVILLFVPYIAAYKNNQNSSVCCTGTEYLGAFCVRQECHAKRKGRRIASHETQSRGLGFDVV